MELYLAKTHTALLALLLHLLPRVALRADEFREGFTIKVMRFVLVVAVTALVELVAARRL